MIGKALLDTNIVIALFKNEKDIVRRIKRSGRVYIPATVLGELYYGAFKSQQIEKNIKRISEFITANDILGIEAETARVYGEIKTQLKEKGKPIPENDIWIAATAKLYKIRLLSKDNHFSEIDELKFTLVA